MVQTGSNLVTISPEERCEVAEKETETAGKASRSVGRERKSQGNGNHMELKSPIFPIACNEATLLDRINLSMF